jgi:hypothetical protein
VLATGCFGLGHCSYERWGKSIEERADIVARGMTGGHLAQWDRHSTEAPIHQLLLTEPDIMEGKERHFPTRDMENTVRSKINFIPRDQTSQLSNMSVSYSGGPGPSIRKSWH